jgi:16S rRNA (guanine1516-N2)-methyltransferase
MENVAVAAESSQAGLGESAAGLARELDLPLVDRGSTAFALLLVVTPERLELRATGKNAPGPVFVDFQSGAVDYRRRRGGGRRQLIARAVGLERGTETVLDATAGLGRDAFALACLGCRVTLVERSPVLAALLADGLRRAAESTEESVRSITERITLIRAEACDVLGRADPSAVPDVVYLDPMYPVDPRRSALAGKDLRICRLVVGADEDANVLLDRARHGARRRAVVKRHVHAPPLDPAVDIRYVGKRIRYDVYLTSGSSV